jgi:hypothetical protein
MPPAARITDPTLHGAPLSPGPGSSNTLIGALPAWRTIIDQHACPAASVSGADGIGSVLKGSPTVWINSQMACRQFDIVVEKPGLAMGPMNPIIMGELTVIIGEAGGPGGPAAAALLLAFSLINVQGTADANDARLVASKLAKFPPHILNILKNQGTRVVVCRGSMTEYRTDLRGVTPRGWPPGSTWDSVPGAYTPDRNEIVVATVGHGTDAGPHVPATGEGHGSSNLVLHESMHGVDQGGGGANRSTDQDFNNARNADAATLDAYESQPGGAGQEETYAESAARYYGGDSSDATDHPNLNQYWASDPLKPTP